MDSGFHFRDRHDAGRALAERLKGLAIASPLVVALPRGGVPVGYEVARALDAPLDIGLVRKLGAPGRPELGIGALGEGGTVVLEQEAIHALRVTPSELQALIASEQAELERRRRLYRADRPALDVIGRTVILVDDGMATGVTAVAAARVLRARGAARIVAAVPVCPAHLGDELASHFDEIVCLRSPRPFPGVGAGYEDFSPTQDGEVIELLRAGRKGRPAFSSAAAPMRGDERAEDWEVPIETRDAVRLQGNVRIPRDAKGLVIFVHGSGSSRRSPRNRAVASHLNRLGFATLLFDLLTESEAAYRHNVFDIGLLTRRVLDATDWAARRSELRGLPVGYFGASTGAAAALRAAAVLRGQVRTVVSRGGRPDLAGDALPNVTAPTLLIVGGDDWNVIEFNEEAAALLGGPHEIELVPHADHLFEQAGAMERVAGLAGKWFSRHLRAAPKDDRRREPLAAR